MILKKNKCLNLTHIKFMLKNHKLEDFEWLFLAINEFKFLKFVDHVKMILFI